MNKREDFEEGFAEFVVCVGVFFLFVVSGVQFALWSHAAHLARAAAEQGSQTAAAYQSTDTAGSQAAYQFISTAGSGTLKNPDVNTTTSAGGMVSVTVTGRTAVLLPFLNLTVSATSETPLQEFQDKWIGGLILKPGRL